MRLVYWHLKQYVRRERLPSDVVDRQCGLKFTDDIIIVRCM